MSKGEGHLKNLDFSLISRSNAESWSFADGFPAWWNLISAGSGHFGSRYSRREIGNLVLIDAHTDPCLAYRSDKNMNGEQEYICLSLQVKGEIKWKQDNQSYIIEEGDLYIWNTYRNSTIELLQQSRTRNLWIPYKIFNKFFIKDNSINFYKLYNNNPIKNIIFNQVTDLHNHIYSFSEIQISRLTNSIIEALLGAIAHDDPAPSARNGIYHQICLAIQSRLDDTELSIEMLSTDLNISDRSIRRACFDHGTTFSALLKEERLRHISRLLSLPDAHKLSLTEIAHRFAFYDLAHFSRAFKQRFGQSPSRYRLPHQ